MFGVGQGQREECYSLPTRERVKDVVAFFEIVSAVDLNIDLFEPHLANTSQRFGSSRASRLVPT